MTTAERLKYIREQLERWDHAEKVAAWRISQLVRELCDMRDRGDITQADVSASCRDGICICDGCTINGKGI